MTHIPSSLLAVCSLLILVAGGGASGQPESAPALPKILLIGDASVDGYAPLVAARLKSKALIVRALPAAPTSVEVSAHLDAWLVREKPRVVFLANSSVADPKVIERLKREPDLALIVAGTSGEAASALREANIPVLNLPGSPAPESIAEAVADALLRQWIVLQYSKPGPAHASGPEAAAKYRETEAKHDAEVPEAFKHLPIGKFDMPPDAPSWQKQRPGVLRQVIDSLGDLPPRPAKVKARVVSRELRRGFTLERVSIDNGADNAISALVLVPDKRQNPAPAVLWLHSSTPDKNALITPGSDPESIGEAFVREGYVVVAPDAWYYGDRAGNVPSGPMDEYHRGVPPNADVTQNSLLKLNLWLGRTVWGMMVRDDQIALDYLCQRPEVDARRIGATGMSMGSTRAWWLAAVDERVAATVGVACLTRYENLIRHGNLRAHGLYYFSYGLLKHFDTEGVLSLLAPRPFLALTGDIDYGSPVDGIRILEEKVGGVYRTLGAEPQFRSIVYLDTGHVYTPEMRVEMLAWFARWLKN